MLLAVVDDVDQRPFVGGIDPSEPLLTACLVQQYVNLDVSLGIALALTPTSKPVAAPPAKTLMAGIEVFVAGHTGRNA